MFARPARSLAAVLTLAGLTAVAPRASAETINLTLNNTGTGVTYKPYGGTATTVNGGPFYWSQSTPLNTNYATAVTTYCIDLDQYISKGSTYTFTTQSDLTLAPTIGTAAKSAAINELFDRYYNSSLTSATNAAAFQLALWELVYDGASSKSLTAGRIQGTNSLTTTMLGSLGSGTYTNHDLAGYHLVGLVSASNQDQIMVVKDKPTPPPAGVPAPPGVILAGLGFGGLMLGRFRRAK